MLAWYTNRAGYFDGHRRPAAQVGLYHPAKQHGGWATKRRRSTTKLGWQLYEQQVDWDYFERAVAQARWRAIAGRPAQNLSGQVYPPPSWVPSTSGDFERPVWSVFSGFR